MGLPEWYLIRAVHLVGNISNHGKAFIGPALKQFFVYLQRTDNCAEQLHIFLEQLQAAKYTILDVFIIRNIPVRALQKPGQYRIRIPFRTARDDRRCSNAMGFLSEA